MHDSFSKGFEEEYKTNSPRPGMEWSNEFAAICRRIEKNPDGARNFAVS